MKIVTTGKVKKIKRRYKIRNKSKAYTNVKEKEKTKYR